MWARHMELCMGLWLLVSPFVLRHPAERTWLFAHDLALGAILVAVPLACHARALRRAHLMLLPVAAWLVGLGGWRAWQVAGVDATPASQNWIMVGLVLAMFAIVPSDASRPPRRSSSGSR